MQITKLVYLGTSGTIDVHWVDDVGNTRRLASYEAPSPDLIRAIASLGNETAECVGLTMAGVKSLVISKLNSHEASFRVVIRAMDGDVAATISTDPIEYALQIVDTMTLKTEWKGLNGAPLELLAIVRQVVAELEEYIGGKRAQKELAFSGRSVADKA